jgi:hypothetical protein
MSTCLVTVSGPQAEDHARAVAQYFVGVGCRVTLDTGDRRETFGVCDGSRGDVEVRVRKAAAPSADARQWLAGLALAGLLARNGTVDVDRAPAEAVRAADGVLQELAKEA